MNGFIKKMKRVTITDVFHLFLFLLAIIPSLILKRRKNDIWLICETELEARDNGYWLYKYIKDETQKENVYYALSKKSPDLEKIQEIDSVNIINYGSFIHWIYYLAADLNISSHKGGKPNAAVCYFLEVYGILKNKRVFLQHGVTLSNAKWLYYSQTKITLFICAANPEYEFIKDNFGYPKNNLKCLGFSRFDNLPISVDHSNIKTILVMPSWRSWLIENTPNFEKFNEGSFIESEYYLRWYEFLNHPDLYKLLEENDLELIFYPHRNIQPFIHEFKDSENEKIKIASFTEFDIQKLLIDSDLLITDYSSVSLDYAYMDKPTVYYQFDYKKFRVAQYEEGYFDYEIDSLGYVAYDLSSCINLIRDVIDNGISKEKKQNFKKFYRFKDNNNSKRIYEELVNLTKIKGE